MILVQISTGARQVDHAKVGHPTGPVKCDPCDLSPPFNTVQSLG